MRAEVARAAIAAGASIINDVSGGKADSEMLPTVAAADVDYVLMHWRGHSTHMDELTHYVDVVADVISELQTSIAAACDAGIRRERIIVDPGFGFAKNHEQNWELVRATDQLVSEFDRVLMGVSRKRMLRECLANDAQTDDPKSRDAATAALSLYFAELGAYAVRVHEVAGSVAAIKTSQHIRGL
jgi:dihydropteroate synthase